MPYGGLPIRCFPVAQREQTSGDRTQNLHSKQLFSYMKEQSHNANADIRLSETGPIKMSSSCCLYYADSHADLLSVSKGRTLCNNTDASVNHFNGETYQGIGTESSQGYVVKCGISGELNIIMPFEDTVNTYYRHNGIIPPPNKDAVTMENIDLSGNGKTLITNTFNNAYNLNGFIYPHRFMGSTNSSSCN
jgi:hypothetical protein